MRPDRIECRPACGKFAALFRAVGIADTMREPHGLNDAGVPLHRRGLHRRLARQTCCLRHRNIPRLRRQFTLGEWRDFRPSFSALPGNLAATFQPEGIGLGSADNPLQPRIGDLRIHWRDLMLPPLDGLVALRDGRWQLVPHAVPASVDAPAIAIQPQARALPWWWGGGGIVVLFVALAAYRRRRR